MNKKKLFGVLAAASMLMNSGVAVFAEEMVETTPTGTVNGVEATNVALNAANFPDANLLNSIKNQNPAATTAGDVTTLTIEGSSVQSLEGLQYLTKLETFILNGNNFIQTLDLTNNTSLGANGGYVSITNNGVLTSITLPESDDLTSIVITGNTSLDEVDLSPLPLLTSAYLNDNSLDEVNLSGNTYLNTLNVENNQLYQLDARPCKRLTTLIADYNQIYEMQVATSVPNGIQTLLAAHNKLASFDASGLKNLTSLDLSDNMLKSVKLPTKAGTFTNLQLQNNHLASLNLKNVNLGTPGTTPLGTAEAIQVSPQNLYANSTDSAVNIKEYDPDFNPANATLGNGKDFNDDGSFNLPGLGDVGTKAQFTQNGTEIYYVLGDDNKTIASVNVYLNDSLVPASDYTIFPKLEGMTPDQANSTIITVTANPNTNYTGSVTVLNSNKHTAINNVADLILEVEASLPVAPNEKEIRVRVEPEVLNRLWNELTGAKYTVTEVTGTATIGGNTYDLTFTQDTNDPSGYTWYVKPGDNAVQREMAVMFEAEETEWPDVPTDVKIHGKFTVTAENLASPLTSTFAISTALDPNGEVTTVNSETDSEAFKSKFEGDTSNPPQANTAKSAAVTLTWVEGTGDNLGKYTLSTTTAPKVTKVDDTTITTGTNDTGLTISVKNGATPVEAGTTYLSEAEAKACTVTVSIAATNALNVDAGDLTGSALTVTNDGLPQAPQANTAKSAAVTLTWVAGTGNDAGKYTLSTTTAPKVTKVDDTTITTGTNDTGLTISVKNGATPVEAGTTYLSEAEAKACTVTVSIAATNALNVDAGDLTGSALTVTNDGLPQAPTSTITVTVPAKGTYKNALCVPNSLTITDTALDAEKQEVTLDLSSAAFTGGTATITKDGKEYTVTFKQDVKGTLTATQPKNAGDYSLTVSAGGVTSTSVTYTIDPFNISGATGVEITLKGITTSTDISAGSNIPVENIDSITITASALTGSPVSETDATGWTISTTDGISNPTGGTSLTLSNGGNATAGVDAKNYTGTHAVTFAAFEVPNAAEIDGMDLMEEETQSLSTGVTSTNSYYLYTTSASGSGNAYNEMKVNVVKEDLMNRLYNPNSGEHFYTKDTHEKDVLVSLGWQAEGIGWVAPVESILPVYRLYNPNAGDHHYTKDVNEKDTLVRVGWSYEGIGWYSAYGGYNTNALLPNATLAQKVDGLEVFREYNPNAEAAGAHNYTISEVENNTLVSIGWIDEGIAWYGLK